MRSKITRVSSALDLRLSVARVLVRALQAPPGSRVSRGRNRQPCAPSGHWPAAGERCGPMGLQAPRPRTSTARTSQAALAAPVAEHPLPKATTSAATAADAKRSWAAPPQTLLGREPKPGRRRAPPPTLGAPSCPRCHGGPVPLAPRPWLASPSLRRPRVSARRSEGNESWPEEYRQRACGGRLADAKQNLPAENLCWEAHLLSMLG